MNQEEQMAGRSLRYVAVAIGAAGCLLGGSAAFAAGTPATWHVVSSPNSMPGAENTLMQVSAHSTSDAWAVGYAGGSGSFQTLTEHWNGTKWQLFHSPSPSGADNVLEAVHSVSASNVWAVGYDLNANLVHKALIEHWNGKAWRTVPAKQVGTLDNDLWGVTALGPRDVWAVGNENTGKFMFRPLVEHWNGKAWSVVPTPSPKLTGTGASLFGVAATSPRDIWAVGNYDTGNNVFKPLAEHWNGKRWTRVAVTAPGSAELNRISMLSPNNGWAVGSRMVGSATKTLIEHWNGKHWSVVKSPALKSASLVDVKALAPNLAWAVGNRTLANGSPRTLIERWNGRSWTVVASPNRGSGSELLGIGGSKQRLWAVGDSLTDSLILRH